MGPNNLEEVVAIKQQLGNIERQVQEILGKSQERIKNFDIQKSNIEDIEYEEVEENKDKKISKKPDMTSNSKPIEDKTDDKVEEKETIPKPVEKLEEKPLEVGDEVYKDGVFYKIHDFLPEYESEFGKANHHGKMADKQGSFRHFDEKEKRWVVTEEKRIGTNENKLNERDAKPHRQFRAVIVGGGMGGGKGAFEHFSEDRVTRVTPELKEKIKKMQKESGRTEGVNS